MVIFPQKHQEFYGYFKEDNGNIVGFANNTTDSLKKHTLKKLLLVKKMIT